MTTTDVEPVLTISGAALDKINALRDGEADGDSLALRIEVTGVRGVDYTYDLAFEVLGERAEDEALIDAGLPVLVPLDDLDKLRGATLDLPSAPGQSGLVLKNPNRPTIPEPAELELTGDLADDVRALLEQRINPAIAAHGGFAELIGVDDGDVYVRLGGGCQGCAMSRATVAAGIEQTLTEALPGVRQVIDVTDHASGENPYYAG